jgi:hypothetical protein
MRVLPRTRLVALAILLATVFTTGALAQDYYYTNFLFGHLDYTLPVAPCVERAPAQAWTFQGSAWMLYHCIDGRDIQRRFMHVSDQQNPDYVAPLATSPGWPTPSSSVSSAATATCEASKMIGATGLNECQWNARYPR